MDCSSLDPDHSACIHENIWISAAWALIVINLLAHDMHIGCLLITDKTYKQEWLNTLNIQTTQSLESHEDEREREVQGKSKDEIVGDKGRCHQSTRKCRSQWCRNSVCPPQCIITGAVAGLNSRDLAEYLPDFKRSNVGVVLLLYLHSINWPWPSKIR